MRPPSREGLPIGASESRGEIDLEKTRGKPGVVHFTMEITPSWLNIQVVSVSLPPPELNCGISLNEASGPSSSDSGTGPLTPVTPAPYTRPPISHGTAQWVAKEERYKVKFHSIPS